MTTHDLLTPSERDSLNLFLDDLKSLVETTDVFPLTPTLDDFRALVDGCVARSADNIKPYLEPTSVNSQLYSDLHTLMWLLQKNRKPTEPTNPWNDKTGLKELDEAGQSLVQDVDQRQQKVARTFNEHQLSLKLSSILESKVHSSLQVPLDIRGIYDNFYPPAKQTNAIVEAAKDVAEQRIALHLDSHGINAAFADLAEELVRFVAKDKTVKGLSNYPAILSSAQFTAGEINKVLGKSRPAPENDASALDA